MTASTPPFDILDASTWNRLTSAKLPVQLPAERWSVAKWQLGARNAGALYELVRATRPRVIVETGTFEAHGTTTLAAAAHANANGAIIFTIDYDGDPSVKYPDEAWRELADIRSQNLAAAREQYPGCEIRFVEGDTRQVLPGLVDDIDEWHLFFQDSMHLVDGILSEWSVMKAKAAPSAVVIFDDIGADHPYYAHFASHESLTWKYRTEWTEHPQLWAQKRA